ncbi:hypothetical protein [Nitrosomonas nitrosa]|uniref:hypothetical protein n=1 Tax=Nitrosomonas nitrosa TaxID=52442 RepID=UPI0023F80154|nr:hypothetical protein [Nitrosomonas nitrosa]MCO6435393.1 hypothetical protein [Nitrosomonas nitrosa]
MKSNPFVYGRPLSPAEFVGRELSLRQIFGWLVTDHPVAVVGQPRTGKTTLLNCIADDNIWKKITGDRLASALFCFLDAQTLRGVHTQAEFWERALSPLAKHLRIEHTHSTRTTPERADFSEREFLIKLFKILSNRFNQEEIRVLCFHLGIEYEDLQGEGKKDKTVSLIKQLYRYNRINEFIDTGKSLRPDITWEEYLVTTAGGLPKKILRSTQPNVEGLYIKARENQFGAPFLEDLFKGMALENLQLILLLDDFDDVLTHPVLNNAEFYGGLRSFASRLPALGLVISTRRGLAQLNELTQGFTGGSPYFNVFNEMHLGVLEENTIVFLLNQADDRFGKEDQQFILEMSGRHPYLFQVAAAVLWDIHEVKLSGIQKYRKACEAFYKQTRKHYNEIWNTWTNETRKVAIISALTQISCSYQISATKEIKMFHDWSVYTPELIESETIGLLSKKDEEKNGNRIITQPAFLWWLAEELQRMRYSNIAFRDWLLAQRMDNLLTAQEIQAMESAVIKTLELTKSGVSGLIDAFVRKLIG